MSIWSAAANKVSDPKHIFWLPYLNLENLTSIFGEIGCLNHYGSKEILLCILMRFVILKGDMLHCKKQGNISKIIWYSINQRFLKSIGSTTLSYW